LEGIHLINRREGGSIYKEGYSVVIINIYTSLAYFLYPLEEDLKA